MIKGGAKRRHGGASAGSASTPATKRSRHVFAATGRGGSYSGSGGGGDGEDQPTKLCSHCKSRLPISAFEGFKTCNRCRVKRSSADFEERLESVATTITRVFAESTKEGARDLARVEMELKNAMSRLTESTVNLQEEKESAQEANLFLEMTQRACARYEERTEELSKQVVEAEANTARVGGHEI